MVCVNPYYASYYNQLNGMHIITGMGTTLSKAMTESVVYICMSSEAFHLQYVDVGDKKNNMYPSHIYVKPSSKW